MADRPLLVVEGLSKQFGGVVANRAISLSVAARGIHALIGPNGAGKTTFIEQLCGELQPDEGTVHFAGEDITYWAPHRRARAGLARSFQITSVMPTLEVLENVVLAAAVPRGGAWHPWEPPDESLRRDARAALARVGLAGRERLPAQRLSHGEQRQLEIAMVVASGPRLLLLDEPAAGAGAKESARIAELLRQLAQGIAIVLVEHDMGLVFAVADRITVLAEGASIASGTPAEIRDNMEVRKAYLGD